MNTQRYEDKIKQKLEMATNGEEIACLKTSFLCNEINAKNHIILLLKACLHTANNRLIKKASKKSFQESCVS